MFKRVYKHYNLLIDICFWIQAYVYSKAFLQFVGVLPTPLYPHNLFGDILFFLQRALSYSVMIILPILLVVSAFRDEYAERIWRRAAKSFVLLILIGPWVWAIGWTIANELHGGIDWIYGLQIESFTRYPQYQKHQQVSIGVRELLSIDLVLFLFVMHVPIVFAAIYKWHRWRDKGD